MAGALAALAVCAVFFFYYQPVQNAGQKQFVEETPTPPKKQTESPPIQTQKINLSEVDSLTINTSYTGFYEANSECAKPRHPSPKPEDTIALSYAPCRTVLTFKRNGEAVKTTVIKNSADVEEKSEWKSKITAEQFEALLKGVAQNRDFIEWPDVMINHSNCTIYAAHTKGTAQIPLYIDIKKGSSREPLVNAFKELDRKIAWQKAS